MVQQVNGSTHRCGNTLNLVITFADCQLNAVTVDPLGIVSDHALVVCRLTTINTAPTTAERLVRGWRELIEARFDICSRLDVCASRCLTMLMSRN